ncbi:MAG TPA: hypothetical protein VGM79_15560 [Streptosporangiaceae bacterium]|jgi:hypothetical protein
MTATKHRITATDLHIDLAKGTDAQVFRWLVACLLFGARISQDIAARAYAELDKLGVLTPRRLAEADWQELVDALGRGGYRRYDESTARELISLGQRVLDEYGGHAARIRDGADTKAAVAGRVQEFTGIGPAAADIFIREITSAWGL